MDICIRADRTLCLFKAVSSTNNCPFRDLDWQVAVASAYVNSPPGKICQHKPIGLPDPSTSSMNPALHDSTSKTIVTKVCRSNCVIEAERYARTGKVPGSHNYIKLWIISIITYTCMNGAKLYLFIRFKLSIFQRNFLSGFSFKKLFIWKKNLYTDLPLQYPVMGDHVPSTLHSVEILPTGSKLDLQVCVKTVP